MGGGGDVVVDAGVSLDGFAVGGVGGDDGGLFPPGFVAGSGGKDFRREASLPAVLVGARGQEFGKEGRRPADGEEV